MKRDELLMELTGEQGPGRESQVQPPKPVWESFFGVRLDSPVRPTFRLENMRDPDKIEQRKVVRHHHNLTIEVSGARIARPAIIRIQRTGIGSFAYWVYSARSKEYKHCRWLLDNFSERESGRSWVIVNAEA
jgi:hypothetical protein